MASTTNSAEKRRWSGRTGERLRGDVLQRLLSGGDLRSLSLGLIRDRVDLRCIVVATNSDPLQFNSVHLRGIDFSNSKFDGVRFIGCVIEDCVFDAASCRGLRMWATDVKGCTFVGSDLRDASVGGWYGGRGNNFTHVDFSGARLSGIETNTATYIDCSFASAELDGVNFWQSSLIRCKFSGRLNEVIFDGRILGDEKPDQNPMLDIDFEAAIFDGCDFRGINFAHVRLPSDEDLFLIAELGQLDAALAHVPDGSDVNARIVRMIFEKERRSFQDGGQVLLNLRDFGVAAELAADCLRRVGLRSLGN